MPIPSECAPSPRRLLRDIAHDQLVAAIMDGTLAPGERLHDDRLASWLGMSRTPIREAIAQLSLTGLVSVTPNKQTQVSLRSAAALAEAGSLLHRLHDLSLAWGATRLTSDQSQSVIEAAKFAEGLSDQEPSKAYRHLLDAGSGLTEATGNRLFIQMESKLQTQVRYLAGTSSALPPDLIRSRAKKTYGLIQNLQGLAEDLEVDLRQMALVSTEAN